jgi:hypothetical protein
LACFYHGDLYRLDSLLFSMSPRCHSPRLRIELKTRWGAVASYFLNYPHKNAAEGSPAAPARPLCGPVAFDDEYFWLVPGKLGPPYQCSRIYGEPLRLKEICAPQNRVVALGSQRFPF